MPMGVKSQMNSGRYMGTISAEEHAKSIIDKLGWLETETIGHWKHYFFRGLMNFPITNWFI